MKATQSIYSTLEGHAKHLCNEGYTIIPEYYKGGILSNLKSDFERLASDKEWDEYKQLYILRDDLQKSIALSRVAVDPCLTGLVEYYWGKQIFLAELCGKRSEQAVLPDYGNNMWHHDAKRKQIKIFILLTDVLPGGQHMNLIPKTHKIWHNFTNYEDTRFDGDQIKPFFKNFGNAVHCTGPAGTVCVFDTNMLHRANRDGPMRDVWVFNYTAGHALFPIPRPHPDAVRDYSSKQRKITRL